MTKKRSENQRRVRQEVTISLGGGYASWNVDKDNSPLVGRSSKAYASGGISATSPYLPCGALAIPPSSIAKFGAYWKVGGGISVDGGITWDDTKIPCATTGTLDINADAKQ